MSLTALSRSKKALLKVSCYTAENFPYVTAIAFHFQEEAAVILAVDEDTDTLIWLSSLPQKSIPMQVPVLEKAVGLCVAWSWEMTNNQGYFDAFQIEFIGSDFQNSFIVQLKVAASRIELFKLVRIEK